MIKIKKGVKLEEEKKVRLPYRPTFEHEGVRYIELSTVKRLYEKKSNITTERWQWNEVYDQLMEHIIEMIKEEKLIDLHCISTKEGRCLCVEYTPDYRKRFVSLRDNAKYWTGWLIEVFDSYSISSH